MGKCGIQNVHNRHLCHAFCHYYLIMTKIIRANNLGQLPCASVYNSCTYLEHRLLDTIAYPVAGVNMSGHLRKFIGPRRWLPLGARPLWVRYCLLQFDLCPWVSD